MDLVTLRTAAGGGTLDGFGAARLVAAGFTLLQRSATLVRALAGKRAAILLPNSPRFLVALAASDGRGAVLMDPDSANAEIAFQIADALVGAVLTVASLAARLPVGTVHVLLDDAPTSAIVIAGDGTRTRVDIGSHFGLALEGDGEAPGRDEECVVVYGPASAGRLVSTVLSHRDLIAAARQRIDATGLTARDRLLADRPFARLDGLTTLLLAPLLAGAHVSSVTRSDDIGVELQRIDGRPTGR